MGSGEQRKGKRVPRTKTCFAMKKEKILSINMRTIFIHSRIQSVKIVACNEGCCYVFLCVVCGSNTQVVKRIEKAHDVFVTCLDWNQGFPQLASGGTDKAVKLWGCS